MSRTFNPNRGFARSRSESAYPQLWDGLVGAWCPSLGPTGAILRDLSGRANHCAFSVMDPGTDWVLSQGYYALDLDATNDHLDGDNTTPANSNSLAVAAWVRPNGSGSTAHNLFSIGDTANDNNRSYFSLGETTGVIPTESMTVVRKTGGAVTHIVGVNANRSTLFNGHRHHVGFELDGTYKFYLDGVLQTTSVGQGSNNGLWDVGVYATLHIGASVSSSPFGFFDGLIFELEVFNRPIGQAGFRLLAQRPGILFEPRRRTVVRVPGGGRLLDLRRRACA